MSRSVFDIAVVGGGPAGAAAARTAAAAGATTVCVDKEAFPRDKACGDGLTPRAVKLISELGLAAELDQHFHRISGVKFLGNRPWTIGWPQRPGMPSFGYVANRGKLDSLLLDAADSAGAEIRQSTEAVEPVFRDDQVIGVRVENPDGTEEVIHARAVVAADGAYSPMSRQFGRSSDKGVMGIAIRAEMPSLRCDTDQLEIYPRLIHNGEMLPGYGWVFPLGDGRVNCGVGYGMTYAKWRSVNATRLFGEFLASLPNSWGLPTVGELQKQRAIRAWRLPMAFAGGPAWKPGILFAGDAVGAIKPLTGAGISRAIQSGIAAAESAVSALDGVGPADFSSYTDYLEQQWGRSYSWGARLHRTIADQRVMRGMMGIIDSPAVRRTIIRSIYGAPAMASYNPGPLPDVDVRARTDIDVPDTAPHGFA